MIFHTDASRSYVFKEEVSFHSSSPIIINLHLFIPFNLRWSKENATCEQYDKKSVLISIGFEKQGSQKEDDETDKVVNYYPTWR